MASNERLSGAWRAVLEYFGLAIAEAAAGPLSVEARSEAQALLVLAGQKHRAASQLSAAGLVSEALPIAVEGFKVAGRSAASLRPEGASVDSPYGHLSLSRREQKAIDEATRAAAAPRLPVYESEVTPAHQETLSECLAATAAVRSACATLCWSKARRAAARWTRRSLGAAAALAALGFLLWLVLPRREVAASASSHWGSLDEFGPANVLDKAPETEWLLNDATAGWIDLRLKPARGVRAVRLLNAHNKSLNDRGTQAFRVELFSKGRTLAAREGRYPAFSPSPEWTTADLSGADVDVVRVHVLSWFNKGGGFAEVEVK